MSAFEVGRVCFKVKGRDAGQKVVVLRVDKKKLTAIIEGPKVKRSKCNLRHLLPTEQKISGISEKSTRKTILKKLEGK
ncbi:MAG: 50S ribosomal protein L14e [Candidatus Diapherotrites archaeon]|nr:50S ribosomal protein L14e [Candidatus Diapherotrites archaeon]